MGKFAPLAALAVLCSFARADVPVETRLQSFDIVWSRVNEYYFDPKFGGALHSRLKDEYRAKVREARNDAEYVAALNDLLQQLGASHFGVIPSAAYGSGQATAPTLSDGEPGLTLGLVEGRPTVVAVEKGSPAERAGVKPGWILASVDGRSVAPLVRSILQDPAQRNLIRLKVASSLRALLSGPVGKPVKAAFYDASYRTVTVTMDRRAMPGQIVRFGELPPIRARVESRRLSGNVGYIRFNVFMMPLLEPIKRAIDSFRDAKGIVLDLRGNPGGVGAMAIPIAAKLTDRPVLLGTMRMRSGQTRFNVNPQPPLYKGPVVVLIDGTSASTSEILAAGLQELGIARLVGEATAGAVLPSVIERLPCGNRLQFAFADFRTPKGVLLEGRGAIPDVPVRLTRDALLREGDAMLQQAVRVALSNPPSRSAVKR